MNNRTISLVGVVVAALLLPAVTAQAVVRYVAADGSGLDGLTWATAYKTIQAAISDPQVVSGSEIHVKAGTYKVTQAIAVNKPILVYGGYSGAGETRDWLTYQTTIDGGTTAPHCFKVTANATIDGFGIFGGQGVGNTLESNGGGINITSCAATINNCLLKYNKSYGFGGGLSTYQASGTRVTNCAFTSNTTTQCGAAIYNEKGIALQISDCTFTQNTAADSAGGIHNLNCTVTITRCYFQGNRAAESVAGVAGGILNEQSPATIFNCVFTGNRAPYGAGIFNYLSSPTIEGCLFTDCDSAAISGGGVYNNSGAPTIKSCLFQRNSVRYQGGGLYSAGSGGKTVNCVFLKNDAAFGGGGIYIDKGMDGSTSANPQFINCTIWGNHTDWRGGAVGSTATPSTFLNCIMWGNTATDANRGIYSLAGWSAGQPAVQYSDVEGDSMYPGTGNLLANPRLADPNNLDFIPEFDSPCLDAGTNAALAGIAKDYEEATRVTDGDGDGVAVVDMGACELQGTVDHVQRGEIMQSIVYDGPTDTVPAYVFLLRLQTNDGLTSVQFQAPGGTTVYTIPADAHKSSGGVDTYHRVQGKVHLWEYWFKGTTPTSLAAFGDGTYSITAKYRNNTQDQLNVVYHVPDSGSPIPQPTQRPQVTAPAFGARVRSPVVFQWSACTDGAANSVRLTIIDTSDQEVAGDVLNATATQSAEYTLPEGDYEAELAFGNLYDGASSDGTPFQFGRTVLVAHRVTVVATAVYRFWAEAVDANFYTTSSTERDAVMANWPDYWSYKGVAFSACTKKSNDRLRPVYRFWSGQAHFFTIDEAEKDAIIARWPTIWHPEGIAFYAYPPGREPADTKAVYRFWNPSTNTHYFTIDEAEAAQLSTDETHKYSYEGIPFYAYPP